MNKLAGILYAGWSKSETFWPYPVNKRKEYERYKRTIRDDGMGHLNTTPKN